MQFSLNLLLIRLHFGISPKPVWGNVTTLGAIIGYLTSLHFLYQSNRLHLILILGPIMVGTSLGSLFDRKKPMVLLSNLQERGLDPFGRPTFRDKSTGIYYCITDFNFTLNDVLDGLTVLTEKGRSFDGEPSHTVRLVDDSTT